MAKTKLPRRTKPTWMGDGIFGGQCFKRNCMHHGGRHVRLAAYGLAELCPRCLREFNKIVHGWPEHIGYRRMVYTKDLMYSPALGMEMDNDGANLLLNDLMAAEDKLRIHIQDWLDIAVKPDKETDSEQN
ncbi:hypothetical protein LCGC14_1051480 [marine sediment metagenome]|uniref:Uncharacterized protein n=1 Tax=marine sediment metagenome TaxID=412755 RepID=A0A0F9MT64_9ZZZZ